MVNSARSYFDHAATAPLRPEAREALLENLDWLNPSGQYASARAAKRVLEEAREQIARLLGCDPVEVVFTSGGTEADNLAISGLYFASSGSKIYIPDFEHEAVLKTAAHLEKEHWAQIEWMPIDAGGRLAIKQLPKFDAAQTAVVSCMWANNETGAIQPIPELVDALASSAGRKIPLHVDAVQAVGHLPINFHASGAATLAISGHKFGGPRGIGALLVRRDVRLIAHNNGGGQERGIRSGTQDVASAAAMAAALQAAINEQEAETARLRGLQQELIQAIASIEGAVVHTNEPSLPGHVFASFPGAEGDSLIMLFDAAGIECSTGSACNAGVNRPSHVLLAMGVPEATARGAIRFTMGWNTTEDDVKSVISVLSDTVARARLAGMA